MRWADLDSLKHVNNVVYLDYAAESRAMLVDEGVVGADEAVARISVDFLRPLLLSRNPVRVMSRRDGGELVQEIGSAGSDVVFARITTTFGPQPSLDPRQSLLPPYSLRLRRSDLDEAGRVSSTKFFEFFQEARVLLFARLNGDGSAAGRYVLGHVDVTYGESIGWRREPYVVRSRLSRIGESSMTVEAEIVDGATVHAHATAVLVGFDLASQRSRKLSDEERTVLAEFIPAG